MDGQNRILETSGALIEGIGPFAQINQMIGHSLKRAPLDHAQMNQIAKSVPGGIDNIQDMVPLTPLQEGLLFHHLANTEFDAYVLSMLIEFDRRNIVDAFICALQTVVNRHDILRASILWDQLPRPIHVIHRRAPVPVEKIDFGSEGVIQLKERMLSFRQKWNLQHAPLVAVQIAHDPSANKWYALLHVHHVICDYASLHNLVSEVVAFLTGYSSTLTQPTSYKDHALQTLAHLRIEDAERFFRGKLQDIDEPTAPFGLTNVLGSGKRIQEETRALDRKLSGDLRAAARRLRVRPSRLFHAAWALVVAHTSGRNDVVFGTVILSRARKKGSTPNVLGLSINTLPIRLQLTGITASGLVEKAHRELVELFSYEQVPLAVAQRCGGVAASTPLFSSLLNFRRAFTNFADEWARVPGVRLICAPEAQTNYPITLTVDDSGDGFTLTAQTAQDVNPDRVIGYLSSALQSLVEALERAPETEALSLSIVPASEREEVLRTFNATEAPLPPQQLVHELFEEQVRRTPQAVALEHEGRQLTYAELNGRANQLARYLGYRGLEPGQPVGICIERGLEMVVGLLGILKAGGAYVPLDPNYPTERLQQMLQDAAPRIVLTQSELVSVLPSTQAEVIALDEQLKEISANVQEDLPAADLGLSSQLPVYVIYTSGSTGRPKGTAMAHCSMVNLIEWHRSTFPESTETRVLQFAALSFDVAFQEIFSTLCTGGTLVLLDEWIRRDARALTEFLSNHSIQRLFVPPLMLQSLAECAKGTGVVPPTLRDVITAGEQLRISPEVVSFFKRLDGCRLHNHYGPTETHVVTALTLTGDPEQWPTLPAIGKPISNTQMYVLDSERRPVPIGVAGEIYIAGIGVARGYLGKPDLTAQRFIQDPFSAEREARMYRTGDLGRWRADGTLEYLGRNDFQVKIRGYRIELGEIEAQLARHAQVKEAAVIAREDEPGQKRLVAYVTSRDQSRPSVEDLRAHLKSVLPEYMVPSAIVVLEQLPLTPSGKLDRRALPAPELDAYVRQQYEAPQGEIEEILAGIWQELLHLERVGRNDNFFELGGHSLLIVQMMERLRRVGLSTEVRRVFESPTLSDLAGALITGAAGQFEVPPNLIPEGCEAITPQMLPLVQLEPQHIAHIVQAVPGAAKNIQDIYPLAPLQEGMLFHHLLDGREGDTYILPVLLSLATRDRLDEFIAALQQVINRHDALRTAVLWERLPQPVQVVYRHAILPVEEIALERERDPIDQLRAQMTPKGQMLDLKKAPLLRLRIAPDPHGSQWYVLLQLHHLICDNMSMDTMLREVMAHLDGQEARLPEPIAYRIHVSNMLFRSQSVDHTAYFRLKLGDLEEPTVPFGLADLHGGAVGTESIHEAVDPSLAKRLRTQARRFSVSTATLFHSAWSLVVSHTSGRDNVVFGSVLLGRLQASIGVRRTLGLFINTLPLRIDLHGVTAASLVEQTQREIVHLLSHEDAPLAMAQRCAKIPSATPLFSTLLNYRHRTVGFLNEFGNTPGIKVLEAKSWTNYPVLLSIDEREEGGFELSAQTQRRIDPQRVTGYMREALQSLVEALENTPQTKALSLPILPASEREEVLRTFNASQLPLPPEKLVHELFEEQVRRTPNAVAVVHEGRQLTYDKLNRWANQLARYLRHRGIGPDQPVGICISRSVDMVIGLLGILKAGGAYVPLDPNYPTERLQHMLEDATPRIVLTQSELLPLLPSIEAEVIALDERLKEITANIQENLAAADLGLNAQHTVYVIYTSGSTGRPKGTAMAHRSMVNLIEWHRSTFPESAGTRVLQFAALSFDVAFQEIFSTLCTGGTLMLLDEWIRRDARALTAFLSNHSIQRLFVPPLMLQSLAECVLHTGPLPESLQDVIAAGEQLRIGPEVASFFSRLDGCRLHNHYGPTETHVVTALTLTGDPEQWPTLPAIGRPISNTQVYVLNREQQPVPIGVAGEIYIGGTGVARGYLGKPELTAQRFIEDPFSGEPGARLYRTGDLGRWRADGTLEYLGRNDFQVKIRGYRIELGEIEAQLARHAQVKEAAVIAREDDRGQKNLVAYVTPREKSPPGVEELRAQLKSVLPEYMVPSAIVVLEKLPLTPSGKLDRRSLPAPELNAYASQQYEAPQGHIEGILAGIWQELLHLERVGRNDNFFELGGHSLLVVKAIVKINETLNSALHVKDLYQNPSPHELADRIAGLSRADEYITLSTELQWDTSYAHPSANRPVG